MTEVLLNDPILRDLPVNSGWKVIGPVAIEKKLGQGGMGAVYKGRHLRLNVPVAVKVMNHHLAANAHQFAERFRREAQVAVSLNHVNLVRCFDVNTEYNVNYMILEFIQGEDAGHRVKRKGSPGLAEQEACAIVAGAAAGLVEAHRRNIVHRDIKPENIMIDHTGRVVLMDLGLAKVVEDPGEAMTVTGQAMGTPNYMSPEQWDDAKSAGLPSDIWALGVTLYMLATGRLPWSASGMGLLMKKVQNDPMDDPRQAVPALSERVVGLIGRCLCKSPAERISAQDLHRELKSCCGEQYDLTDPAVTAAPDSAVALPSYPTPASLSRQGGVDSSGPASAGTVDGPTVQLEPAGRHPTGSTDPTLIANKPKIPKPVRADLTAAYAHNGNRIPSGSQIDALAREWSRKHNRSIESKQVFGWFQALEGESRAVVHADGGAAHSGHDSLTPGPVVEWGQQDLSGLIDSLVREHISAADSAAARQPDRIRELVQVRLKESLRQNLTPAEQTLAANLIDSKIEGALRTAGPLKPGCILMGMHPVIHLPIVLFLGLIYLSIPQLIGKEEGTTLFLWLLTLVMGVPNLLGLIGGIVLRSRLGPSVLRFWATLGLMATFWLLLASGCMMTGLMWGEIQ